MKLIMKLIKLVPHLIRNWGAVEMEISLRLRAQGKFQREELNLLKSTEPKGLEEGRRDREWERLRRGQEYHKSNSC